MIAAALGVSGESGEFADHVKKWWAQGHTLDSAKVEEELGDVLWYVALACSAMSLDMGVVAERNIEKLRARYPEGFSTERSINR